MANMWSSSYNLIANANNFMSWLDRNGERVINSQETRDMMRGEALALRGCLHFDLLRLWGPIYATDSTEASIPYRTVADASRQPLLPANEVVTRIMADLSQARTLLSFEQGTSLEDNERRFRLNYYAVTALMARVCNYRGDHASAMAYAEEVINDCGLGLVDNCRTSPALFGETLFAINIYEMEENLSSYWAEGPTFNTQLSLSQSKLAAIFETNGDVSVIPKACNKPLTAGDMGVSAQTPLLPYAVICEGKKMTENVRKGKIDYSLVEKTLEKHKLKQKNVLLMTVTGGNNYYLQPISGRYVTGVLEEENAG